MKDLGQRGAQAHARGTLVPVMRFALIAGAAMCALNAHRAQAQNSVTLYGIIDTGFTYTNNNGGHSLIAMQDGNQSGRSGSRWGLRGNEALGGGLSAIFLLENGFTIPNGAAAQGGLMFGRQAYVGLGSPIGTVTLGRQYDTVVDMIQPFSAGAQWAGYMGGRADDIDNVLDTNRTNNAIKYTTPIWRGLRASGMYSFGGIAGDATRNQVWSFGVGYESGGFKTAAAWLDAKQPDFGYYGGNGNALTPTSVGATGAPNNNNIGSTRPAFSGFASASGERIASASGSYTYGPVSAALIWSNVRYRHLGALAVSGTPTFAADQNAAFNSGELNLSYQLTPAILLGAAYSYTRGNAVQLANGGTVGAVYQQIAAGLDYGLSKRTDVNLVGVYQRASGVDSTGAPAHASINGLTPSTTSRQVGLRLALRTKF
ncbi:porin [Burkholderia sp. 3C]